MVFGIPIVAVYVVAQFHLYRLLHLFLRFPPFRPPVAVTSMGYGMPIVAVYAARLI